MAKQEELRTGEDRRETPEEEAMSEEWKEAARQIEAQPALREAAPTKESIENDSNGHIEVGDEVCYGGEIYSVLERSGGGKEKVIDWNTGNGKKEKETEKPLFLTLINSKKHVLSVTDYERNFTKVTNRNRQKIEKMLKEK